MSEDECISSVFRNFPCLENDVSVTEENKQEFFRRLLDQFVTGGREAQMEAIKEGLGLVLSSDDLGIFFPRDFQVKPFWEF